MNNPFELKIIRHHWVKDDGINDREDLCSHGVLFIRIGKEILSDENTGSWCTTAAGLHLMRTLYADYDPGDYAGQLIPCCGHFIIPNVDGIRADVHGCFTGIDWIVNHDEGMVELITESGIKTTIPLEDYKKVILEFANSVETFYGNPKLKVLPEDELEKNGFELFWNEWHSLKVSLFKNLA